MPTYVFKNNETGEVFEKFMRISESEQFLKENPCMCKLPTIPNFQLKDGPRHVDSGFKDVIRKINNSGIVDKNKSTLNRIL